MNWRHAVLIGLVLVFCLRFFGLNQMVADDESANLLAATAQPYGSKFYLIPHPPTVAFVYSLGAYHWGHIGARVVTILVGLAAILLTYYLARRMHDESTALVAASLLVVSFWHFYESIQLNVENVFSLVVLLVTICYMSYIEQPTVKKAAFTGVALGALFLTKYSAVLVAAAIGIHALLSLKKQPKQVINHHALAFGIAAAMLGLYLLAAAGTPYGSDTVQHGADYFKGFFSQDYLNLLSILMQAILFMSPLLLGLFLLSLFAYDAKHTFLYILIAVFVIFYMFILGVSFRAFERFWTPLMPALAIIGAAVIMKAKLTRKEWCNAAIAALAAYALLLLLIQLLPGQVLPLYPKSAYISRVLSLQWNFFVPFHSSTGPFGFFVQFSTMIIGFILAFAALLLYKLRPALKAAFVIFLGIGLAYNAVMIQEYLWSPTSPDVNAAAWEVHDYVRESIPLSEPLAIYELYGTYLLQEYDQEHFGYAGGNDPMTNAFLGATNRTIVIVNYPVITKESAFWGNITRCEKVKTFTDKGVELGYVFDCKHLKTAAPGGSA